jgi:hypothetical protein
MFYLFGTFVAFDHIFMFGFVIRDLECPAIV